MCQHQNFVKAKKVVDKLPSLASEVGIKEFTERIDVLQCIHDIWACGGKVIVVEEDDALGDNKGTTGLWRCLPAWEVVLGVFLLMQFVLMVLEMKKLKLKWMELKMMLKLDLEMNLKLELEVKLKLDIVTLNMKFWIKV